MSAWEIPFKNKQEDSSYDNYNGSFEYIFECNETGESEIESTISLKSNLLDLLYASKEIAHW